MDHFGFSSTRFGLATLLLSETKHFECFGRDNVIARDFRDVEWWEKKAGRKP